MKLSHSTLVLPSSFVDFVRNDVLQQIRGLYDGKIKLRNPSQESFHHLPVTIMDNGAPITVANQKIIVNTMIYDQLAIEPENQYSAAGVLAIAHLETSGKYELTLALRFRVFLYREHRPNAYMTTL